MMRPLLRADAGGAATADVKRNARRILRSVHASRDANQGPNDDESKSFLSVCTRAKRSIEKDARKDVAPGPARLHA